MSNRTNQFETAVQNPAQNYLSFKSKTKNFESYDKVAQAKSSIELPLKMVFLKQGSAVKGWNEEANEGIYSNIVTDLRFEDLRVRQGSVTLFEGKYSDIKVDLKAQDISYNSKIFAIVDGGIIMLTLKGSATGSWFEFAKENEASLLTNYIEVKTVREEKKGAVAYSVPVFTLGAKISKADVTEADTGFDAVEAYLAPRVEEIEVVAETIPAAPETTNEVKDNLPF